MASITASAAQHPAARPAPARKLPSLKSACIAAAAYLVGVIFLLPYLEMV